MSQSSKMGSTANVCDANTAGALQDDDTPMATISKPTPSKKSPGAAKKRSTSAGSAERNVVAAPIDKRVQALARDLRSWADFVLGVTRTAAGAAADLSFTVVRSRLPKPAQKAALDDARSLFRDLRDAAGLTLTDLGQAINLKDTALLEAVEGGKVGLPFEVILRLAAVLGRNDPIPVVLKLTRAYNPKLWITLESLGIHHS